jgi:hypothetical protein
MHGDIPPLFQYSFMAWYSVKAQGQLYTYILLPSKENAIIIKYISHTLWNKPQIGNSVPCYWARCFSLSACPLRFPSFCSSPWKSSAHILQKLRSITFHLLQECLLSDKYQVVQWGTKSYEQKIMGIQRASSLLNFFFPFSFCVKEFPFIRGECTLVFILYFRYHRNFPINIVSV